MRITGERKEVCNEASCIRREIARCPLISPRTLTPTAVPLIFLRILMGLSAAPLGPIRLAICCSGGPFDPADDQENPPEAESLLMRPDPMMVAMLPAIFFSAHHGYFGDGKVARAARTEWPKPYLRSGDLRPSHKPPEDDGSGPIGIE